MDEQKIKLWKKLLAERGASLELSSSEVQALQDSLDKTIVILKNTESFSLNKLNTSRKERSLSLIQFDLLEGFWSGEISAPEMRNLSDDRTWKWTIESSPW
jgi:hypothetical protein